MPSGSLNLLLSVNWPDVNMCVQINYVIISMIIT